MDTREFPKGTIEKAEDSDPEAIAEIFEHYYAKIYRGLYYRTRTIQDAEDLAGEVFVKVLRSIRQQSGNFEAWLHTIAKNTLTDHYRRNAARKETGADERALENLPEKAQKDAPGLTTEELKAAISKLTGEQQEVVILRFIEGYDTETMARITGKTIGAVKAAQFRGLAALKEIFKEGR